MVLFYFQLAELERVFSQSQYPDTLTMEELADKLNVTIEKISVSCSNKLSSEVPDYKICHKYIFIKLSCQFVTFNIK